MHVRRILISLAIACSFPAARAQLIVSSNVGTGGNVPQGYTWYIDVATGERTILFKGGFNAIGADDANGKVYLAGGPLFVWNYGSSAPPQLLGPVRDPSGQLVIIDGLAFGGGALFGAAAVNQPIGLYRLDLTTMIATKIVLTSAPSGAPEGLAFNAADGMFYGVKDDDYSNQPGIYRYDLLGSGVVTLAAPLPPLPTYDTDGLAIGNGRAYVITDSHSPFAVWDFATQSYLTNTMTSPFALDSYLSGGDWAPSLVPPNQPWVYCEGKVDAQHCVPLLGWNGNASASGATPFQVLSLQMRANVSCGLFYSLTGPASTPFNGGVLCLAAPVQRTFTTTSAQTFLTSCNGMASFDFNAFIASGTNPSLVAGQTVWMQCLSRDPGATVPSLGFSPAMHATIQP